MVYILTYNYNILVQKYNNIYNKKKDGRVCNENLTLTEFKSALKSLHTELLNDDDD